jgi:RND family efflux transporter MFP subunit
MSIALPSDPTFRRRLLIALGIGGLLAVSGTIYAITSGAKPKTTDPIVYELADTDVLQVKAASLKRSLRLSGTLAPLRHAIVKSHSVGTVLEIRVHEGDRVRTGALLVRIDPRNLQATLDSQNAALRKANADLLLATKNRDNSVTLLNQKLISQNAFDQTEATYAASVANVEAAQAQVRMAQIALSDTEIRAEFDGIIAARSAQVGERVMPDSSLLTIVDLATMQLEALVPVADVPSVKVGQTARFTVDGFGSREFAGHVERINPQAAAGARSLSVYLTVANDDSALKGGMFAQGELVLQQTAPLLAVPNTAIRDDGQHRYVLVLHDGQVAKRDVTLGDQFETAGLTEIREGLTDAAQVIVAPVTALKPGMRAKVTVPAS